jgi:hypothetical protein
VCFSSKAASSASSICLDNSGVKRLISFKASLACCAVNSPFLTLSTYSASYLVLILSLSKEALSNSVR